MKARVVRLVLAVCLVGGVVAADAAAATGDLIQKPGADGCLSTVGFCSPGRALAGAGSVAVSPDGQNAYVVASSSEAVSVFDRAADGTLTQKPAGDGCISNQGTGGCVQGTALIGAASVTVSPDGRSVYVASPYHGAVTVFDRAADGTLAQKPAGDGCISNDGTGGCVLGTALDGANSVAVSPDGRSAYVASRESNAVAVFDRAADGKLTQKLDTEGCISEDGAGPCFDGTAVEGAHSVAVSPDGRSAYVASSASNAVALFDRAPDGTLRQKPRDGACVSESGAARCTAGAALDSPRSVTVSPDGKSTYVASYGSDAVALFDRAPNGALTQKAGRAGCVSDTGSEDTCVNGTALSAAYSVTVSPDGQSAYVASSRSDAVAIFDRAPDGTLTQKLDLEGCISEDGAGPCFDGTALDGGRSVTVSPDGQSAYVASFTSGAVAVFDRELIGLMRTPPPPTPPPHDTTRPRLSPLALSPARFRAAGRGPSIGARVGATVSYRLSEPAAVRFRVERALPGRRAGGRCVKPKRSNRRAKHCTRYPTLRGGFSHHSASGPNVFKFSGRLRAHKLPPGRYRLRAVATDPAGNESRPKHSRFRIVAR